jgi:hypothetical protein
MVETRDVMEHGALREHLKMVVRDSSGKKIGIWKWALVNHVFAWLAGL